MKKFFYIFFIFFIPITNIYSQKVFASQNASASAILVIPLSIISTQGELDFGEVFISDTPITQRLAPQNGKLFIVSGTPNRSVTFTFNSVNMSNVAWVPSAAASIDELEFVPDIELEDGAKIKNGDSHSLPFVKGIGQLDVWVGGAIKISATQKNGNYTGQFTLNVSY